MKKDTHIYSFKDNVIQITVIVFVAILIILNTMGVVYLFFTYQVITATNTSTNNTIASKLVSPFNTRAYDTLLQERATKQLYSSHTAISPINVPEVFGR